ncbi:uncharacterized protein C8orf48 homolog isoform X1 [Polyodon spathula]|uniref:uncharacterized protein C8orf48 homolog isoform X1 n=1 Tax=Polyodon spathula TaxID=7913 RepID=UPI001B7EF29A|nr:uncharacterized protein C8orf48 homolog isoform X1 [Polyodon spathula]XP_041075781.1 uncharacterized protein C8orf48 homolog isoform X1 [Polyodon spathula]
MTSETEASERQNVSRNYEDESFESWPISNNSSTVKYPGDSLDPCSVESERAESYSSSESFESYCSHEEFSPQTESRSASSVKEYQDEESESCDDAGITAEEELAEKWMRVLKHKDSFSTVTQARRSNAPPQRDVPELFPEESKAVKSYCREKIRKMRRWQKRSECCRHREQQQSLPGSEQQETTLNCRIPEELVTRLQLKHIMKIVKQATEVEIHQPSMCSACLSKRAELARESFIQIKKTQLESVLLQEKLEENLYNRVCSQCYSPTDPICLVGEVLKDLPKLSDDPSKIWHALIKKEQVA